MKINWKLRLQNKLTLSALISAVVVFVYEVAGALGFVLPVSQEQVLSAVAALLAVLVALGVVVDPTTKGADDSNRALGYEEPAPNVKETK
jgi:phi LC3 family holin|nr:MAG TPA: holin [Caudoviricetes sp.]